MRCVSDGQLRSHLGSRNGNLPSPVLRRKIESWQQCWQQLAVFEGKFFGSNGGADGIRTHDLLDAIEARSQLRHGPTEGTAPILTSRPSLRLRLHSVGRKEAQRSTSTTLLVLVVGLRGALTDRLVVFVGDPAGQSRHQSIGFRGHQAGCPK